MTNYLCPVAYAAEYFEAVTITARRRNPMFRSLVVVWSLINFGVDLAPTFIVVIE